MKCYAFTVQDAKEFSSVIVAYSDAYTNVFQDQPNTCLTCTLHLLFFTFLRILCNKMKPPTFILNTWCSLDQKKTFTLMCIV